jgi:hypothetical protein
MPLYPFVCPRGHETLLRSYTPEETILCGSDCSEIARRRFSFRVGRAIPSHFNNGIGKFVNNEREFRDELKKMSDRQSETVGYDTTFDYVDPADVAAAAKVTEEGLDESRRRRHDALAKGVNLDEPT